VRKTTIAVNKIDLLLEAINTSKPQQ